jgi:hypothetical protein
MSDYPMLISNKLHSFRNFLRQKYNKILLKQIVILQEVIKYGLNFLIILIMKAFS